MDIGAFGAKAKPGIEVMRDLAVKAKAFADVNGTPMAMNMLERMGFTPGMAQLLIKGGDAIDEITAKQRKNAEGMTENAARSEALRQKWVALQQGGAALGQKILSDVTPALEKLLDVCEQIGIWIQQNTTFVEAFLFVLATGIAAVAVAALPFTGIAAAIMAVAAAIAFLYTEYDKWKKGEKGLIDWDKWGPALTSVKNLIVDLWDAIKNLTMGFLADTGLNKAIESFMRLIDEAIQKFTDFIGKFSSFKDWIKSSADDADAWVRRKMGKEPRPVVPNAGPPSEKEKSAMSYFQSKEGGGWSKEQAAGIVASLKTESGFNEKAVGDNGKAAGIGQWHPDRQAEFQRVFGHPIQDSTFEEQLAFVNYELTHKEKTGGDALRNAKTAQEAGSVFSKQVERPGDTEGEARRRGQLAQGIANGISGATAAAQGAGAVESAKAKSFEVPQQLSDNSDRSIETRIGTITVNTQATDANGIARDMHKALDNLFTSQANYGLA